MFLFEKSQLFLTIKYGIWEASEKNFSFGEFVILIGASDTQKRVKNSLLEFKANFDLGDHFRLK